MGSQRGRLEGQSWAGELPPVLLPADVKGYNMGVSFLRFRLTHARASQAGLGKC